MSDELGLDLERLLRERGWLRALARGLVSEGEVEDLVQESWLAALSARSRPQSSLRAWFTGLARNAARGLRRERGGGEPEWDAFADTRPAAGELLAEVELQERLIAAVRALREPYRTTVLLHYFEELSLEEVGRRTGVPSSTARTRLARALAELRGRFEREPGSAAWALVLAFARGGAVSIPTSVMEVTLMGTLAKVSVAMVAAAGVSLVVWWRQAGSEERSRPRDAEARTASVAPEASRGAQPLEVSSVGESRTSAPSVGETRVALAPAATAPAPLQDKSLPIAASPLERNLDAVADTFITEEPDVAGLLSLSSALAMGADLVPESLVVHPSGSTTGKLDAGGNLTGTFSCRKQGYRVELSTWNTPAALPRTLTIDFTEEEGTVGTAVITVHSAPMKDASHPIGGQELIGWRLMIDGDGARVHRTSMLVEENPSSDHYNYLTSDVQGVVPREMPWITTDALDPWLTRLRALHPR